MFSFNTVKILNISMNIIFYFHATEYKNTVLMCLYGKIIGVGALIPFNV